MLAVGRDTDKQTAARSKVPGLQTFAADLADPAQRLRLRDFLKAELHSCEMLINNAGIMRAVKFNRIADATAIEAEIAVNLVAPIELTALFIPLLRGRPDACIVNVSSGLAYAPFPNAPVYSATKAALHSFNQSLRIQLRASGLHVVEIIPPTLDTPMISADLRTAMKGQRMETVETVTSAAIRRIEAGQTEIPLGASSMLRILSRLAPGLLMRQMAAMNDRVSAA